jgi:hypothetical protein
LQAGERHALKVHLGQGPGSVEHWESTNMKAERKSRPSSKPEPQGPARNEELISPGYKDGPYPAERPGATAGEGSGVATHSTGLDKGSLEAARKGSGKGGPLLDEQGRTEGKKKGREKNEP